MPSRTSPFSSTSSLSRPLTLVAAAIGLVLTLLTVACAEPAGRGDSNGARASGEAPQDTIFIDQVGYDLGDPDAPVIVIEFSDFGCPYCARFALETFPEIHREYIETGKVYWKYVPFVMGTFPNGSHAAMAAECAAEQGEDRFWQMHDELYREQRAWKATNEPAALLRGLAGRLGLDADRFASCLREGRAAGRTRMANQLAAYAGVRATPTFIINGFRVQGALPLDHFRMILDRMAGADG